MLARLPEHGRIRAIAGWDPAPSADAAVSLVGSVDDLLATPGVDCVYIASPPASHLEHAHRAFDAGLPVFCEKPLAVDFEEARRAIERIDREGCRAAVNFSLASSAGLMAVAAAVAGEEAGALARIEIDVAFKEWPRPWQAAAGKWLAERREGGFTREVLSHFIFVLQRVLGKALVEAAESRYPPDGVGSEISVEARLRACEVPVMVTGRVAGEAADYNRFALVGDKATIEFRDWLAVKPPDARPGYLRQLDQLAAFIEGRPHTLPGFQEALAVQETIEAMLEP